MCSQYPEQIAQNSWITPITFQFLVCHKDLAFLEQFNHRRDSAPDFPQSRLRTQSRLSLLNLNFNDATSGELDDREKLIISLCFRYKSTDRRWKEIASFCACKASESDLHSLMSCERRDSFCQPLCPASQDESEPGRSSEYEGDTSGYSAKTHARH